MTDPFASPASTGALDYNRLIGSLLLIDVISFEKDVQTTLGPKDAIRADVTVLDGPDSGDIIEDALIFPKVLCSQLRSKTGQKVLGRLGQGTPKPGQNAPWTLSEATDRDRETGLAHLAGELAAPAQDTPASARTGTRGKPPF